MLFSKSVRVNNVSSIGNFTKKLSKSKHFDNKVKKRHGEICNDKHLKKMLKNVLSLLNNQFEDGFSKTKNMHKKVVT